MYVCILSMSMPFVPILLYPSPQSPFLFSLLSLLSLRYLLTLCLSPLADLSHPILSQTYRALPLFLFSAIVITEHNIHGRRRRQRPSLISLGSGPAVIRAERDGLRERLNQTKHTDACQRTGTLSLLARQAFVCMHGLCLHLRLISLVFTAAARASNSKPHLAVSCRSVRGENSRRDLPAPS